MGTILACDGLLTQISINHQLCCVHFDQGKPCCCLCFLVDFSQYLSFCMLISIPHFSRGQPVFHLGLFPCSCTCHMRCAGSKLFTWWDLPCRCSGLKVGQITPSGGPVYEINGRLEVGNRLLSKWDCGRPP